MNATDSLTQEEAVMEAIYTKGPMTVSVNAEGEDWRFYKAGIYNNTRCSPKLKRLDHAVVVSGCAPLTASSIWRRCLLCVRVTALLVVAEAVTALLSQGMSFWHLL